MDSNDWKNTFTTVAIANQDGSWQYITFNTWEEAREAINAARREGKAAVFYDGATFHEPPHLPLLSEEE